MNRKYYIDNLKWICILLLLPFHAAIAFNNWGEANYIWFQENQMLSFFVRLINPYYMPLLMVLAGISAKYSMKKRSTGEFVLERLKKLLLPFITCLLTVVAGVSYFADRFHNGYKGDFFEHYKIFFTRITDLTGYDGGLTPAHLWFVLYLFIISMVCLIPISIQKKHSSKFSCEKIHIVPVFLMAFVPLAVSPILNFGGKSITSYLVFFLLGYYLLSEETVLDKIVQHRLFTTVVWFIMCVINIILPVWMDNVSNVLATAVFYFASWFGILTIIGFARDYFSQNNDVTKYFTSRSFGIYIFHMLWVVILQFYLFRMTESTFILFFVPVAGASILTILTVELIGRIPGVRVLYAQYFAKRKNKPL